MIELYILIIGILLVPLFILISFLWDHRKENGSIGKLRKVIGILAFLKILYFLVEMSVMASVIVRGLSPSLWILIPRILTASFLAIGNWWALIKIKKIQNG